MSQTSEDIAPQSRKIFRRLYGGVHKLAPHQKNVHTILRLCGAIPLLVFILSLSNLATLLILRCSFQRCQRIFANWSKKVES